MRHLLSFPRSGMALRCAALGLLASLGASVLLPVSSLAEPERGRLSDGRAFRTDAEGNQLVDYIAELELNVDALKARVTGLEDEVKEKQALVDRLREDGRREVEVREKNLLEVQQVAAKKVEAATSGAAACTTERSKLNELTAALELAKSDLEVERQISAQKIAETQARAEQATAAISTKASDVEALRTQLAESTKREAALSADLSRIQRELQGYQRAAAQAAEDQRSKTPVITSASLIARPMPRAAAEPLVAASSASSEDARASLSVTRMRAVEVVRGKLRTEVNQVRGSIATRDDMFRRYSSQARAVQFTPSKPVSSSGRTLSDISKRTQEASTVSELSTLMREVGQIEQKINDDITLMRRMNRVR